VIALIIVFTIGFYFGWKWQTRKIVNNLLHSLSNNSLEQNSPAEKLVREIQTLAPDASAGAIVIAGLKVLKWVLLKRKDGKKIIATDNEPWT
jgi:hypothetical protein